MKRFLFVCLCQALLCTLVCGHHGGPHDDDDDHDHDHDHDHNYTDANALLPIALANMQFSYKLYSHLAATYPDKNLFFSPLSISFAFSLLSLGAKSKTLSQLREGFGFNTSLISEENIHRGFKQLMSIINQPKNDIKLDTANALFIDSKLKILDTFLDGAKNLYHSEAISTDFTKANEAVKQINSYVEKKTDGKIEELFDSLDPLTVLVIVNTILFKGSWEHAFNVNHTREKDFHVDENTVVKVPMMTRQGKYLVAFLPEIGCTVVDVPYKGNTSAIFIIPKAGKLHDVEKALQNVSLKDWTKLMRPMNIILSIPKFSMSAEIDLLKELPHLGIIEVFSDSADLSGITEEFRIAVSKAIHKAEVDIDEKGTEAVGATGIGITKMSLPRHVIANHPFIIIIQDKATYQVFFTGRVINPTK